MYNFSMGTLGTPTPATEERSSSFLIIVVAVVVVFGAAGAAALFLREKPRPVRPPSPYLTSIQFSNLKMSAAENFIGATVSYLDGSVTNAGNKTVTRIVVDVTFKDSLGQVAQSEPNLPLRVVRTNGAYEEPVDLATAPLAPGQTTRFRLTFDRISEQWNREYPDIRVTDVAVK